MTFLLLTLLGLPALAQAPEPYPTTVRLIDNLFLEQDTLSPKALLAAAAHQLSNEVPWLFVRDDGDNGLLLTHGSGTIIGRVVPTTMDELPNTLHRLERLVADAGYPVPATVDLRLTTLEGTTRALDRYSRILTGDGLSRFDTRLKGTMVGVGVSLLWQGDALVVTRVDPAGPGQRGGLRIGDRLIRIDGRSTHSMPLSEATERLQGEDGTPITLTVQRQELLDRSSERTVTVDLPLVRAEVVVPNVTHRELGGGIGYVHIEHVSQQTVANLQLALDALDAAGAMQRGLVLDLRGNTGGSMKEAARSADVFLDNGMLLRTVGHDGGRVQNLEAEMRAIDNGQEPHIPVVLLVNERTASGAEIIAGALLEHQRTVLIGSRTYGKGTVQKIYTLDDATRLKLTVARYLLANDRPITPSGIVPDGVVASIELDERGMHLDPGVALGKVPNGASGFVARVTEGEGWRGQAANDDVALEMARRTLMRSTSPARADLLVALNHELAWAVEAQENRLAEAMSAHTLDWSPAEAEGTFPNAVVTLRALSGKGDTATVEITLTNEGAEPLHRAVVELRSDGLYDWNGWAVPFGKVEAGATVTGQVSVPLRPDTGPRDDLVEATLYTHRNPPLAAEPTAVRTHAVTTPEASLTVKLNPHGDRKGPHGYPVHRAEVTVTNHGPGVLTGVEVTFGYPDDERVELLDRGARIPRLGAGESGRIDLAMELAPGLTGPLALDVQVQAERFGRLLTWPMRLPTNGADVVLRAPRVESPHGPRTAAVGQSALPLRVRDDGRVDHVELWVNYRKVAWLEGHGADLRAEPTVPLLPGNNTVLVLVTDDQGLETRHVLQVHGEEPSAASAD